MIPRGMAIVLMDAGMCAVAEGQVDCSFDDDSKLLARGTSSKASRQMS
jgi:hypothetical protein